MSTNKINHSVVRKKKTRTHKGVYYFYHLIRVNVNENNINLIQYNVNDFLFLEILIF